MYALATTTRRAIVPGMRSRMLGFGLLLGLACGASSCGVAMMPLRVVGSVAQHTYTAGEKAVTASSKALDERNAKKQAAKQAEDKAKDKDKDKPPTQPTPAEAQLPAAAPTPVPPTIPPPPLGAEPETLPPLPGNNPPPSPR